MFIEFLVVDQVSFIVANPAYTLMFGLLPSTRPKHFFVKTKFTAEFKKKMEKMFYYLNPPQNRKINKIKPCFFQAFKEFWL